MTGGESNQLLVVSCDIFLSACGLSSSFFPFFVLFLLLVFCWLTKEMKEKDLGSEFSRSLAGVQASKDSFLALQHHLPL